VVNVCLKDSFGNQGVALITGEEDKREEWNRSFFEMNPDTPSLQKTTVRRNKRN